MDFIWDYNSVLCCWNNFILRKMKILIDINHPADVHQFKHVIKSLKRNNDVLVVARDKECVYELLQREMIDYVPRKGYNNFLGKAICFLLIDLKLYKIAKKFKPDVLVGSSGNLYVAHVGKLIGKPSVVFDDTEHSKIQNKLCFPFATIIITPESYKLDLGDKQVKYPGSKELAYLGKDNFKPRKNMRKELKLSKKEKLIFVRLVSWEASHDLGKRGILNVSKLVKKLDKKGKVAISSEKPLPSSLEEYEIPECYEYIHDLMYHADLVISEGGTVAVEAAVLGTPVIYVNELSMGYSDELVEKGKIIQVTEKENLMKEINMLLKQKKRNKQMKSEVDLNQFMVKEIKKVGR